MSNNTYGLSFAEIDTIQPIDPEIGAHNIALAYVQSALSNKTNSIDEITCTTIFDIANAYSDAYNYAYNFISHNNTSIEQAE